MQEKFEAAENRVILSIGSSDKLVFALVCSDEICQIDDLYIQKN